MNKAELRKQLKQARLEMTNAEHTVKSRQIVGRLKQATDWSKVKSLHFFEPIDELLEPDIIPFIEYLEDNYPTMQLCTPRLIKNEWRLIAARKGKVPNKFDVVIVPMLGFDPKTLHRIGYGGGYYDKFLATQPQALKIGVCFEPDKVRDLPAEKHDVRLDGAVTEENSYKSND